MLYKITELVPGDQVTKANEDLADGPIEHHASGQCIHKFVGKFENGFTIQLFVMTREVGVPVINVRLHDAENNEVCSENCLSEPLDQDYEFEYADHTYRYTIEREAVAQLSGEIIAAYLEYSRVQCPHCGCDEINRSTARVREGTAACECRCCACNARWQEHYELMTIESVDAPTLHVRVPAC